MIQMKIHRQNNSSLKPKQRKGDFMIKRIISIVNIFILLLSTFPVHASERPEYEIIGDFKYIKGTNQIIEYLGDSTAVEFPENTILKGYGEFFRENVETITINKNVDYRYMLYQPYCRKLSEIIFAEGITEIYDDAVIDLKTLKKVTLPSTLKKIGKKSFYGCSQLEEINLPEGLQTIGEESFYGCKSLTNISLPSTIKVIEKFAFSDCSGIESIEFPDGLEIIGAGAFLNTGLSGDLHFPDSMISIGGFGGCEFDNVYLPENLEYWGGASHVNTLHIPDSMLDNPPTVYFTDEIIFNSDMTLELYRAFCNSEWCKEKYLKRKTDKSTGNYKDFIVIEDAIVKYVGNEKDVVIPDGITRIVEFAFRGAYIDTITFPDSLEVIEQYAFLETSLKEVILPKTIKEVGHRAFDDSPMITKVIIEGTPKVGDFVFGAAGGLNEEFGIFEIKDPNFEAPEGFYNFRQTVYTPWTWYTWYDKVDEIPDWMFELEHPPHEEDLKGISIPKPNEDEEQKKDEDTVHDNNKDDDTKKDETDNKKTEADNKKDDEQKPTDSQSITVWSENENIKISVDDKEVIFPDAMPFVDENSRTLSPIRAISEAAGFTVAWDGEKQKVSISKDGNIIILYIGSPLVSANGKAVTMDTKAQIINGRTYIPVRFIGESLGYEVIWK